MNGLIEVSKDILPLEKVKQDLRIFGKGYQDAVIVQDCFKESSDNVYVPVPYAIKNNYLTKDNDSRPKIKVQWPKLDKKVVYRHNQKEVIKDCVEYLKKNRCGRLQANTGFGKSFSALHIARELNTNILFLVHKNDVLTQIKKIAKDLFNIPKCGEIKGKKCELDEVITLCTMQTMAKRVRENPNWLDNFGMICLDEAHRASCNSYVKIMDYLNSDYKLAISATFRRSDNLIGVYEAYIGDLITKGVKSNVRVPKLEHPLISHPSLSVKPYFDYKGDLSHTKAVTEIADNTYYNQWITQKVVELVKEGRKPLVATDRKDQLELLEDMLSEAGLGVGIYAGGKHREKTLKESDLIEGLKKQVVLCTTKKIGEGFDFDNYLGDDADKYQEPDTIILTSLTKDSEQVIGRISRKRESKHPLIIHPVIDNWYCKSFFKKCCKSTYVPLNIVKR